MVHLSAKTGHSINAPVDWEIFSVSHWQELPVQSLFASTPFHSLSHAMCSVHMLLDNVMVFKAWESQTMV